MAKPTSAPIELTPSEREEVVTYAREHLIAAAVVLKTLGPSLQRVGWMVEDTLVYLEQALVPEEEQFEEDAHHQHEDMEPKRLEAANAG